MISFFFGDLWWGFILSYFVGGGGGGSGGEYTPAFCFIFWPWVLDVLIKYESEVSHLEFCPMHSSWSGQMVMECLKTYIRGDGFPCGTQSGCLWHRHVMRQGIASLGCGDVCQASPLWSYCLTPFLLWFFRGRRVGGRGVVAMWFKLT